MLTSSQVELDRKINPGQCQRKRQADRSDVTSIDARVELFGNNWGNLGGDRFLDVRLHSYMYLLVGIIMLAAGPIPSMQHSQQMRGC